MFCEMERGVPKCGTRCTEQNMGRDGSVSNSFGTMSPGTYSYTISIPLEIAGIRAEIHKYYEECDWSKKWAEGLQKILT